MNSQYDTYFMFYRLATAMYQKCHDRDIMRGWVAHKMTKAFYETSGSVNDKFEAAFEAENLDFSSALKSMSRHSDGNPEWQAAMAVIIAASKNSLIGIDIT